MANLHGNFSAKTVVETAVNCPNNVWTALPTTALNGRNYMEVYNKGEYKLYLSFDSSAAVQHRTALGGGELRGVPVQDNLTLYGRSGGAGSVRAIITEYR
ncbi:MAG: hypothetical protein WC479_12795 [Candidatus Izemoplasmatales bacterium]|jgi:hypothetical protein